MSKPICVSDIKPGERFSVDGHPFVLVYANPCRAYIQGEDGQKTSIAPNTVVDAPTRFLRSSSYIDALISEYELEKARVPPKGRAFPLKEAPKEEEEVSLTNLWCQHGCPAKMPLPFRGKTITLIDGSVTGKVPPVSPLESVARKHEKQRTGVNRGNHRGVRRLRLCIVCGKALPKGAKCFCSIRCGNMAKAQRSKGLSVSSGKPKEHPLWTIRELLELGPSLRRDVLAIIANDSPAHAASLCSGLKKKEEAAKEEVAA